ncbi:hypothetical protein ACQ4N7_11520 [Nodosilinea sp. AN01ver1]|uniref:hypothetical protein n=1 Tax=Nodosilinea sp. AN01ver1 TaxID=3423362 RepID=UPI003D318333
MISSHQPIFIHSLFRTGSTYIFNVFRRSNKGYSCYQEPLNEYIFFSKDMPGRLLDVGSKEALYWRHPSIKDPYFYEFYKIFGSIQNLLRKEFSYDHYFASNLTSTPGFYEYIKALINNSNGRPLLQLCRSLGRAAMLKSHLGGVHVYLWRNPWDQWWSCKLGFDTNHLLILNAANLPSFLGELRQFFGVPEFHSENIFEEYNFFSEPWLSSRQSYMLFYALWCYGMLEALPYCDISIDIDNLSYSEKYKEETLLRLSGFDINELDFSDCKVPIGVYDSKDIDFFRENENFIHDLLIRHGYSKSQIDQIQERRIKHQVTLYEQGGITFDVSRDASRARELTRKYETELAELRSKVLKPLEGEYQRLQGEYQLLQEELILLQGEHQLLQGEYQNVSREIYDLKHGRLWRITAPFRRVGDLERYLKQRYRQKNLGRDTSSPKKIKLTLKKLLLCLVRQSLRLTSASLRLLPQRMHRSLKVRVLSFFGRFPWLKRSFKRLYLVSLGYLVRESNLPTELQHISPHARKIHADLQATVARQQRRGN